jgi:hypothetical protein
MSRSRVGAGRRRADPGIRNHLHAGHDRARNRPLDHAGQLRKAMGPTRHLVRLTAPKEVKLKYRFLKEEASGSGCLPNRPGIG